MKKIVLVLTILTVLMCFLALTVSAAESNEFGTVEKIDGMSDKSVFGDDGYADTATSRVVLYDGEGYFTYPSYYIFQNKNETALNFDELNGKTGKAYTSKSVIRVEVPKNMKKLYDCFRDNSSLLYVYLPETVTVIGGNAFWACHGLTYINVPRDCVSIESYAFIGCGKLEVLDMTEAKSLKRTGDVSTFEGCSSLKELICPEGFEHFGGASGITSLKELYLPNSTTYMAGISRANSLKKVEIPLGVTTLRSSQFDWSPGINTIVLHKGITSIASNAFTLTYYVNEFIYTGSEDDAIVGTLNEIYSSAKVTYANHCDVYYNGEHLEDNSPCVINCTRCDSVNVPKENAVHSEVVSIDYANGYHNEGAKITSCSNEGCPYSNSESVQKLFECLGYSTQMYDSCGISISFRVDSEAVKAYEALTGTSLEYGVFVVLQEKLGENDIFSDDGKATDGVINAVIKEHSFCAFELKITGFDDSQKNVKLALGAYVKSISNGKAEYSYIQENEPNEGAKYSFATFNEIVSK